MAVTELNDDQADVISVRAVEKLANTDDWEIVLGGYKPELKDVRPDVTLSGGRRVSFQVTITVLDHDPGFGAI